jgi:hypothetical protein
MRAHRRNVKNKRAHVYGPKKKHDKDHAEETSEGRGKDHGEQARKGGINRVAPHQACNYRPCKHRAHGKEARRRTAKAGPAAQK